MGKLILSVPFLYGVHEAPHDYHRWTAFKLRAFCEANGLKVLELQPYGGGLEVVLDIVGKHLDLHPILSAVHLFRREAAAPDWTDQRQLRTPQGDLPNGLLHGRREAAGRTLGIVGMGGATENLRRPFCVRS